MTEVPEPKWIQKIYKDNTGEDFLGLRSVQANITEFLLPGIITTTSRARYYAFYSWLLYEYKENHPNGMSLARFMKRREQIFALANLIYNETNEYGNGRAGLVGTIVLRQHLGKYGDRKNIPLSAEKYVSASYGGYDTYAGIMQTMGLIRYSDPGDGGLGLLPKSKKLADGFRESIKRTQYFREREYYDTAKSIPYEALLEYGKKCYLSALSNSPDGPETIEVLFGFDADTAFHSPQVGLPTFGNMGGSLGLMLDMFDQSNQDFGDQAFRDCIMYGGCPDFKDYIPAAQFEAVLSHWRMFQLREYYVYSIYEFWIFFLSVLRENGPFSFDQFLKHLDKKVNLSTAGALVGLDLPNGKVSKIRTEELLDNILSQSKIKAGDFEQRCKQFSNKYKVKTNEKGLQSILVSADDQSKETLLGISLLLLASVFLRLRGIQACDHVNACYWAKEGGSRRRSISLFVQQFNEVISENWTLLQTLEWLFRDYVLAQHTITSIEKWQQRSTNTFHFKYENGIYEWIEGDWNTTVASRFIQAFSMIRDLGLVEVDEESIPQLTPLGVRVLKRVKEKLNAGYKEYQYP